MLVNGPPNLFLALEVTVQTPLGQARGLEDVTDGGVEIALDGKKLQGFFNDVATCQFAFGRHGALLKKPTGLYYFRFQAKVKAIIQHATIDSVF
jgi:hypothetical protein